LNTNWPTPAVIVKTYLSLADAAGESRQRIEEGLWHLGQIYPIPEPVFRELAESEWAEAWKKQYHRQRVGQRTVIVPAWESYQPAPDEVSIRLEPGMAFGTGLHPTTRLCLQFLETRVVPGCTVLDVGTGSGVLAISAAKLGAASILALDADPVAVRVARENAEMNEVAGLIEVRHGSLPGGDVALGRFALDGPLDYFGGESYDLVIVNIVAPVIVGMAAALAACLKPQGWLVAAGLIQTQEQEVRQAFRDQGLAVVGRTQEKDWVGLEARRE